MEDNETAILAIVCIFAIVLIVFFVNNYVAENKAATVSEDASGAAYAVFTETGQGAAVVETEPDAYAYLRN